MFIIHREGPASRRAPARASERLRRLQHLGASRVFTARQRRLAASWAACSPTPTSEAAANTAARWHEAAIKTRRQNAFDDYIAAARWLVSAGYTTPSKLVSRGNSNGGLLVAVTAMQAPEAFGAVFCRVPILDMLRFPRFGFRSAATVEYGSPDDPVEGAVSRRLLAVSQRPSRSPLSRDGLRAGAERPDRAAARPAQDGRQAAGRSARRAGRISCCRSGTRATAAAPR